MKIKNNSKGQVGVALTDELLTDMEFLFERAGLKSHLVDPDCHFQGELSEDEYLNQGCANKNEFRRVVDIIMKYSSQGYVFTDENGELAGNACTVPSKQAIIRQGL